METFEVRELTFYYPEQSRPALDNVSFSVRPGQFVTVCGLSGCGKTTLLRQLKPVLAPHGIREGKILFEGNDLAKTAPRIQAERIGFVQQSPEKQIVTDKVWHELAFGLESLGCDSSAIRSRVAEMASFFGMESWFYKNVSELSGGQKQLLNLASIMAMRPSVLLLDEPTSQLDPIAASTFLTAVKKINRELGVTVILTEHRLEEVFPLSDRVLVMDKGRIAADGTPSEVGGQLKNAGHTMFLAMPTAMRVWAAVKGDGPCPLTVRDGRDWLDGFAARHTLKQVPEPPTRISSGENAVELHEIWFRYERNLPDVVKGASLRVRKGEFFALLGGNGAGKSTLLSIAAGLRSSYRGERKTDGSVAVMPQDPQTLFVKKTVREDLYERFQDSNTPAEEQNALVDRTVALCRLEELLDRHPYDLSGGEQQRAALTKVLLSEPDILLLDEPTKGLDAAFKQTFAGILKTLQRRGMTIFMVSHDVEFCAEFCDRCALFFDGSMVSEGTPREFFSGNSFYTTFANRMARGHLPKAVTVADVIAACGGEMPPRPVRSEEVPRLPKPSENRTPDRPESLPRWRKAAAALSAVVVFAAFIRTLSVTDLSVLLLSEGQRFAGVNAASVYWILGGLLAFALAVTRKAPPRKTPAPVSGAARKLPRRTLASAVLILLLIPLTLFFGIFCFDGRRYYLIALLILLETMLPFFFVFEGRRPQPRELVVIAVLCALGVAGRAAFFMLPNVKPVMAIVILSGAVLGGESGFLVGAMTMLTSNVLFGQGPWTPWQMFAMGIIGFLAGVLYRRGLLRRTRSSLCVFGALCAIVIYGGIMNPASALLWTHTLEWKLLLTYYVTGLPMDLVQAFSTALILWVAGEPFLEKLDRIQAKYGLTER